MRGTPAAWSGDEGRKVEALFDRRAADVVGGEVDALGIGVGGEGELSEVLEASGRTGLEGASTPIVA